MSTMNEISRRISFNESSGMACGPISISSIIAEIVVQDNSETVYLYAEWVSEAYDDIYFIATRESMYDISEQLASESGDEDVIIAERERIEAGKYDNDEKYRAFYKELQNMIIKEMEVNDYEPNFGE